MRLGELGKIRLGKVRLGGGAGLVWVRLGMVRLVPMSFRKTHSGVFTIRASG